MKKEDNNNAEQVQALVGGESSSAAMAAIPAALATPMPQTREQLEIIEELQSLERAVEDGFGKLNKVSELADAGTVVDVVDAYLTTFMEKDVEESKIVFTVVEQETGIERKVMQSDDSAGIRRKYATLFSRCKVLGIPREPLRGYQFVYGDKIIAGNKAIILEKVRGTVNRLAA